MLAVAVGLLLVLGGANGNWIVDENDASFEGMDFFAWNLECNDAKTKCSKCYIGHPPLDFKVLHVFEYTKDPYKFTYTTQFANRDWEVSFDQDDASEEFHYCVEIESSTSDLSRGWTWNMCLENDFTGLAVPPECSTPVAAMRAIAHPNDGKLTGHQVLYCLP